MDTEKGKVLLPIARAAIASALDIYEHNADESAPWLSEHGASFVTLTRNGELRGCIGSLQAHRPLLEDVRENAVAAALYDPRFPSLRAVELEDITIEVSVLSQAHAMAFVDETDALAQLRPGIDGLIFEYRHFRSTFLPQVWEQLPQPREFMAHLKHKAGLHPDFWNGEVKLSRYTVSKWTERDYFGNS